jgi:hypothetical protein
MVIEEQKRKKLLGIRGLEHLISYANYQFGDRVPGKSYRARENGQRIENYEVEIRNLFYIYGSILEILLRTENYSVDMIATDNRSFPYLKKSLEILKPWSIYLDTNPTNQSNSLVCNNEMPLCNCKINTLLDYTSQANRTIGSYYVHKSQANLANSHLKLALSYARLYEGKVEDKARVLCLALWANAENRMSLEDRGRDFAEEAYNCVAIAYNPVHPEVQKAAAVLIECLNRKGDLYDALRFAQFTLDSLKDPANGLNQESLEVAKGYYNLGSAINKQWNMPGEVVDIAKAEVFARESLRIYRLWADNLGIGSSAGLLAAIFSSQNNLGHETEQMLQLQLASCIKTCGPEGVNTSIGYCHLATYYNRLAQADDLNNERRRNDLQQANGKFEARFLEYPKELLLSTERMKNNLQLSKSKFEEGLRINTKLFGPNHPTTREISRNSMLVLQNLLMVQENCNILNRK